VIGRHAKKGGPSHVPLAPSFFFSLEMKLLEEIKINGPAIFPPRGHPFKAFIKKKDDGASITPPPL